MNEIEYPHLPKAYQPAAVVVAGLDWQQTLAFPTAQPQPLERLPEALAQRLLQQHRPQAKALSRYLELALNPALQLSLAAANPLLPGLRQAAMELGLRYYAENPELLATALRANAAGIGQETFQDTLALTILTSSYMSAVIFPWFFPLDTAEKYQEIFRRLPAPLLLASLGHSNAIALQQAGPGEDPLTEEQRAPLADAANFWLTLGALTAASPAARESIGYAPEAPAAAAGE